MNLIRIISVLLIVLISEVCIFAQESADSILTNNNLMAFVNLYHQHHDFFGEAFHSKGLKAVL